MPRVRAVSVQDVPEGEGIVVDLEGKRLAIFRSNGEFFALDETCPHRGGPLHEGSIREGVVACPWHMWRFNLRDGRSPVNPLRGFGLMKRGFEGNDLFVELGESAGD